MSNRALNAVFEDSKARGSRRLILITIADQADEHGYAWPSHRTLMKRTKVSKRSVQRYVHDLQELGELTIIERIGTSNLYRVTVGVLRDDETPPPEHLSMVIRHQQGDGQDDTPPPEWDDNSEETEGEAPAAPGDGAGDVTSPAIAMTPGGEAPAPPEPLRDPSDDPSENPLAPEADATTEVEVVDDGDGWPTAIEVAATEAEVRVEVFGPCDRPLCDRGAGHGGPHRDIWFEAVGAALQQTISPRLASRAGEIARQAEDQGHPPHEILRRAAVILAKWGPDKLTINSLREHWDWAGSPLREISEADVGRHVHQMRQADRIRRLQGDNTPPVLPESEDPERGTS